MSTDFESYRRKYKPDKINFLLVAEAPPKEGSDRFFYIENVPKGDSLFLETMKVLHPQNYTNAKTARLQKRQFLERFRSDGFYLIDSTDSPMEDNSPSKKRDQIRTALPSLRNKLRELTINDCKIILISATVFDVCFNILRSEGFNIINTELIDFPGSGGQVKFRNKFSTLLNNNGRVGGT